MSKSKWIITKEQGAVETEERQKQNISTLIRQALNDLKIYGKITNEQVLNAIEHGVIPNFGSASEAEKAVGALEKNRRQQGLAELIEQKRVRQIMTRGLPGQVSSGSSRLRVPSGPRFHKHRGGAR